MKKVITIEDFLKLIPYKPKYIGKDIGDGVRFVSFRDKKKWSTNLEFGTTVISGKGQYLYWEIVDWNDYEEGDIINQDSDRRHDVLNTYLTEDNKETVASNITESLRSLYRKSKR